MTDTAMNYSPYLETPTGLLEVIASEHAIRSILFVKKSKSYQPNTLTQLAQIQIKEYFQGFRKYNIDIHSFKSNFQT